MFFTFDGNYWELLGKSLLLLMVSGLEGIRPKICKSLTNLLIPAILLIIANIGIRVA